jgi:hypothetical protein
MRPEAGRPLATPPLAVLTELAREARDRLPSPTPAQLDAEWAVVSAHIVAQKARRRIVRVSTVGALAASVLVAVVMVGVARRETRSTVPPLLTYQVEGGSVADGGYLRESGLEAIKLHFSEGTEFVLTPGTRGRLRTVTNAGARIAIEHGTASFRVTPRSEAKWEVDVGPFLVTVKGTAFTVSWEPVSERFDLRLQHGQVSVTGPVFSGEISVKAGQRLTIDLPGRATVITDGDAQDAWPGAPVAPAPMRGDEPALDQPLPAAEGLRGPDGPAALERKTVDSRSGASASRGWVEAVATGNWDRVLRDVDRAGVKQTLAEASSDDLLALADAARYRRRTSLARAALLAERSRFPGSRSALDAAFLLGRLEESGPGEMRTAVRWYDIYLASAPTGTYASEALGRKMMVTKQLRGVSDTESLAREYLQRFPAGPYAGAARALLLRP